MNAPTVAYPVEEARKRLGDISRPTLYKLVKTGRLKVTKLGRRTVITDKQIAECLAGMTDSAA